MASSSSNRFGGWNVEEFGGHEMLDLRFVETQCFCRKKAAIRIVETEKPTKGRLYFNCEKGGCRFFAWCYPQLTIMPPCAEHGYGLRRISGSERGHNAQDTHALLKALIVAVLVVFVMQLFDMVISMSKN